MNRIKPQIARVSENEVLLNHNGEWLYFKGAHRLIQAESLEDVLPALREIEDLVSSEHWHAAGFLSYEAAPAFDPVLQTRPASACPYLWFGIFPAPQPVALPEPPQPRQALDWHPATECNAYHSAISRIKDHIASGRTYQVNYTMRLETPFTGDAWDFFLHLAQDQNQYAAYIDTGRQCICSASPELFFRLEGSAIRCQPMKGTTGRGRTTSEDEERSAWLRQSPKNRAENVMIVDMIRNDLGRIAETGSVSVPRLFETARYPTLWQMTSTIQATTQASLEEIFAALFPCASITGAPKISTMQIISDLEESPRQIYTGTIGYIAPERRATFSVAIRTALIDRGQQRASYGVGGGIVWDSNSEDEYREALLKAGLLTQARPQFSLLETMLWTPEAGYVLREKHVARMIDSARYFDIPIARGLLEALLEQIASAFLTARRVRVLLDRRGSLTWESASFFPADDRAPLTVSLAADPVDAADVFLFHKTTLRAVYEQARRGRSGVDDVLLHNREGELTEFTIGNLVAELEGQLVTPPLACGVLGGTFRSHLLETGQIVERTIWVDELPFCKRLFRVNSIRGWQPALFSP